MDPITIGLLVGGGMSLLGGFLGANAQQNIAEAQLAEAGRNRTLAMGAAQPTAEELQLMGQQLQQYEQANSFRQAEFARLQQTLQTLDPTIFATSQQIGDILAGKEAATLAPIRAERARGQQMLEGQLADRMGAGWKTSTAGLQAQGNYQYQTGQLLANAQLQGLSQLSSVQGQLMGARGSAVQQGLGAGQYAGNTLGEALGSRSSMANRMINAINATPTTQYAGAGNIGQGMLGAGISQLGGNAMNFMMLKSMMG